MTLPNVLVADEDTDTRLILRALLELNGFTVEEATNSAHAVELVRNHSFALIILNHPMSIDPVTSLAGWLRAEPSTQNVPIINLTSRALPAYMEEASLLGVTVTMAKPIDVLRMMQIVRELTGQLAAR